METGNITKSVPLKVVTTDSLRREVTDKRVSLSWPLIRLLRPRHYIKNVFVLAPVVFSGLFLNSEAILQSLLAFGLFCIASSATYVLNDIMDVEKDRLHAQKRLTRPLAAGVVSIRQGWMVLAVLYAFLIAGVVYRPSIGAVLLTYVLVNVAYSTGLKNVPPLDLFVLSSGFLLRVYAGSVAVKVELSIWMFVTTLCLALYLAAVKRRQELVTHGPSARRILEKYTPALLDSYAQTSAIAALLFYGLFAATVRPSLAITVPVVLFGLFRYRFITETRGNGESPTDVMWTDVPLILTVLVWGSFCIYAIWSDHTASVVQPLRL